MPSVDPSLFDRKPRSDGKAGYFEMMPTTMKYVEADGSDIRVYRVRVYREDGSLEHVYLRDTMGVPFMDMPDIADDIEYLQTIRQSRKEIR